MTAIGRSTPWPGSAHQVMGRQRAREPLLSWRAVLLSLLRRTLSGLLVPAVTLVHGPGLLSSSFSSRGLPARPLGGRRSQHLPAWVYSSGYGEAGGARTPLKLADSPFWARAGCRTPRKCHVSTWPHVVRGWYPLGCTVAGCVGAFIPSLGLALFYPPLALCFCLFLVVEVAGAWRDLPCLLRRPPGARQAHTPLC